jgi:UDP-N-acetylmuramoyl-tripeptide--D-alanyl-D-alanine ligase
LFVALQGPRFDGHDCLRQAQQQGAVAALVSHRCDAPLPQLVVADTRLALGQLAALWRDQGRATVVAVTGSNGKTTVKEMLAAILGETAPVLATRGNLNNDIGLPLTLLRLQDEPWAVVELGASGPGEIDYLTRIARPDVALLNNAGPAHLEGFGDIEGVARAKAEIIHGLAADGCFVFNADYAWAGLWRELAAGRRMRSFAVSRPADVTSPAAALSVQWQGDGFISRFPVVTPQGEMEVELSLAGEHNRMNALAAITVALELGIDLAQIRRGLAALKPVTGRLQPLSGSGGIHLIDDSYNANPDSVQAAIQVLAAAPGRRLLVLGELAELGPGREAFLHALGEQARAAGIDRLYALNGAGVAADGFGPGGERAANLKQLLQRLHETLQPGDRVLVKGSRSAGMERVVQALAAGEGD